VRMASLLRKFGIIITLGLRVVATVDQPFSGG